MRWLPSAPSKAQRICSFIRARLRDERGQSSVEAAILIPTVLLLVGMLVQPVCLLYSRSVMRSAASEALRLSLSAQDEEVRAFVLRRLAAIPAVPMFHVGSDEDWSIELDRGEHDVTARVVGHARPLPLLGIVAAAFGGSDADGVVLRVEVSCKVRPAWLGGEYEEWISVWG